MKSKMMVVLMLAAGFAGGMVARWFPMAGHVPRAERGVVKAREFRVIDDAGRIRGSLGLSPYSKSPALTLDGAQGEWRIALRLSPPSFSGLYIYKNKNAGPNLGVAVACNAAYMMIRDDNQTQRVGLSLDSDIPPSIVLSDKKGRARAILGCGILTGLKTGNITQRSESSLLLMDSGGKVLHRAP